MGKWGAPGRGAPFLPGGCALSGHVGVSGSASFLEFCRVGVRHGPCSVWGRRPPAGSIPFQGGRVDANPPRAQDLRGRWRLPPASSFPAGTIRGRIPGDPPTVHRSVPGGNRWNPRDPAPRSARRAPPRWSLVVLAIIAAAAGGLCWFLRRAPPPPPPTGSGRAGDPGCPCGARPGRPSTPDRSARSSRPSRRTRSCAGSSARPSWRGAGPSSSRTWPATSCPASSSSRSRRPGAFAVVAARDDGLHRPAGPTRRYDRSGDAVASVNVDALVIAYAALRPGAGDRLPRPRLPGRLDRPGRRAGAPPHRAGPGPGRGDRGGGGDGYHLGVRRSRAGAARRRATSRYCAWGRATGGSSRQKAREISRALGMGAPGR